MIFKNPKYRLHLIIGALTLCGIALGLLLLYWHLTNDQTSIDTPLQNAFNAIPSIHSYTEQVETQTAFPSRELKITGTYIDDATQSIFASYSTTTLVINGDPVNHVFTHQNIVISADVYTKIETSDKLLKTSIQSSPTWRHFKANAIPTAMSGISIPGPIQDNLQVLGDNGIWLKLTKKWGKVAWGDESVLRYTFKLSDHTLPEAGNLSALLAHIGSSGTIDVWIDPTTSLPRHLLFKNYPYVSTTTIQDINVPALMTPPIEIKS